MPGIAGAKLVGIEQMTHMPLMDDVVAPPIPTFKVPRDHYAPRVLNVDTRNICEITSQLAQGFLDNTDWSYWAVSTGDASWLHERMWWQLDHTDPWKREHHMLNELARQADIIHLNSYHTWDFLSPSGPDLTGKKMVIHHHGCELRNDPRKHEAESWCGYTRIVSTPDLLLCGDDLQWLPSPLPMREIEQNYPVWESDLSVPPVLGHAYTVAGNKGTDHVREYVKTVQSGGVPLQYKEWHGVQRRQSLWLLSQCDMFFSTMLYGPGLASYEAMAMGIPVLLGCTPDELAMQKEAYGVTGTDDLPFVYVTPRTVHATIEQLANEPDLRCEIGRRARETCQKFHSIESVVQRLKTIYEEAEPCRSILYHGA